MILFYLFISSFQSDHCHQLAKRLMDQFPDMDSPVLIRAAQFVKDKKMSDAVTLLAVNLVFMDCILFVS